MNKQIQYEVKSTLFITVFVKIQSYLIILTYLVIHDNENSTVYLW